MMPTATGGRQCSTVLSVLKTQELAMLNTILLIVALAVCAVLVYAATKPDAFRVERSIVIQAPADKVFPLLHDFHQWERWSPWEKIDPALQRSYSGASAGVGAIYGWQGNKDIGHGRMEVTESTASSKVVIALHFIKPFEAHNTVEFVLRKDDDATRVIQAMYGPSPYISKLMSLVFSMDKMVGSKYEEGLGNLKSLDESSK
jgi:Polyketide cyclase / dehydrase and lipid transport